MAFNNLLKGELSWLKDNSSSLSVLKLDGIEFRDLRFPNDESYRGGWKGSKPEGEGCYTWADGSTYEGAWHAGLKHGWGTYRWPNGACYQGEWRDGFMQGYGTFESPDGARYSGNWHANLKHGIGKKVYANGDSYEGLWRNGKAEGPGRYVWHNGNQYDGEWRAGKMHGQGTLKWITGERYDGEWLEGQEDGIGVFTWRDGSTYEGFWQGGKKTGVGVFRPAANSASLAVPTSDPSSRIRPAPTAAWSGVDAAAVAVGDAPPPNRSSLGSPTAAADAPLDSPSAGALHRRERLVSDGSTRGFGVGGGGPFTPQLVYVCQYERGKLVHEEALSTQDLELIFGPSKQSLEKRRRLRRARRRQVRLGETIYKGHRSYDLMLNLQLGIRYTITTLNKLPAPAHLTEEHYSEKVWLRFPREGSEVTPPHPSNDFKWKDYCTTAFKRLRDLFGVDHSQYILSICGDQALREMPSPGKSGSVFFISHDDQYMIKTMHKEEIKLLLSMLPKYVKHAEQNPETLLTRFYGVHRVKPSHGRKVRFVVMNNVFRTELELHRKYDLKGSTYGRTAGPKPSASAIRKDLDLDVTFRVDPKLQARLAAQLAADCTFLEEIHVMDYSLLLGLHRRHLGDTSASPLNTDKEDNDAYVSAEEAGTALEEVEVSDDGGGEVSDALHDLPSRSMAGPTSGSLLPGAASGGGLLATANGRGGGAKDVAESRRARRSTSGLDVAPISDNDADMTRSMHSMTIEHPSSSHTQQARHQRQQSTTSMEVESRSPSFLRGLTWRSFTSHSRRPSQPQLAAAPSNQQPATQPLSSAQVTPRVQPSILPTPRLATTGVAAASASRAAPPLANGSTRRLAPLAATGTADIAAALRAAAEEAEAAAAAASASASAVPAQGLRGRPGNNVIAAAATGAAAGGGEKAANGHLEHQLQQGDTFQQQQPQEQQQQAEEEDAALPTWRSDAVQLPEQQLVLPDGIPASPTGSLDTTGSMPWPRGGTAPPLGAIQELPGSGRELEEDGIGADQQQQAQQQRQAEQQAEQQVSPAARGVEAAARDRGRGGNLAGGAGDRQEATGSVSPEQQQQQQQRASPQPQPHPGWSTGASPFLKSLSLQPPEAELQAGEQNRGAAVAAAAAQEGGGEAAAGQAAGDLGSPTSSLVSSAAATPTSAAATPTSAHLAAAAAGGTPARSPLRSGVPRIALKGVPQSVLQPQRESNDWMQYSTSISDMSGGGAGREESEGRHPGSASGQQRRPAVGDSPTSDATSSPLPSSRRRSMPLPAAGGSVDVSPLLEGVSSASPAGSGRAAGWGGRAAPATARAALGGGALAATPVHRLAQAGAPESPFRATIGSCSRDERATGERGAGAATGPASPTDPSPRSSGRSSGRRDLLARTASAPAGQLQQAATLSAAAAAAGAGSDVEGPRRGVSHQRGLSMVMGRDTSVVDLTSPEAVAVAGRITSRLSARRVTDQLVQDLVKLARYRMVGATSAAPSARHCRMPTMVLAARHMRRSSGGGSGAPTTPAAAAAAAVAAGAGTHTYGSSQDEVGVVAPAAATAAGGAAGGAAAVQAQRLGAGLPAVAVSQQAGQAPEDVMLFFGIIDFLQEYNMRKMLEHSFKAVVQDAKGISVVEPKTYARRFLKFMEQVFPAPTQQQPGQPQ